MNGMKFLEEINDLPEDLVAEGSVRRRHPLLRLLAVFVCVLLVLSSLYPFFRDRFTGTSGSADIPGIYVNGAAYEIQPAGSEAAERAGLPDAIQADMVGMQVEELEAGTVHLYLPDENQRAVYILREPGGSCRYLLFAGDPLSGDAFVGAEQMFLTYGAASAEDLVSLTWRGEVITDREALDAFYQALLQASACGAETFRAELDDGLEMEPLLLEAAGGLRWTADYSASAGVLAWFGSYYAAGTDLLP